MNIDHSRFNNLTFDDFKELAKDPNLSKHEKVGFPDSYREGVESIIFQDICSKLTRLHSSSCNVLEIGPGCSNLPVMLADLCAKNMSTIFFVDSAEMLSEIPSRGNIKKIPGKFPDALGADGKFEDIKFDVILAYSVIQYVFSEGNFWNFLYKCLELLKPGGQILFGDIPNSSMRQRFLSSDEGVAFLKNYDSIVPSLNQVSTSPEIRLIDDQAIFSILQKVRDMGFHGWVSPQMWKLPMSNRREDILIQKPL